MYHVLFAISRSKLRINVMKTVSHVCCHIQLTDTNPVILMFLQLCQNSYVL